MTRQLVALLILAGCAAEAPPAQPDEVATGFDARAWVNAVEVALADSSQLNRWNFVVGPQWETANAHLQLDRACDSYFDGDELVYDPLPPDSDFYQNRRGLMEVTQLGPDEAVVTAQCTYGAYQGSYLMIHVEADRAALLSALVEPGESELRAPLISEPRAIRADRRVSTFSKARGLSDCGTYTTYRIGEGADLQTVEVRQRECSDDVPDEIAPETWPVVYRADG
ncbi:MAG: hypothetical protein Rubg2KO_03550 [Rubricoccaceae bacterium]